VRCAFLQMRRRLVCPSVVMYRTERAVHLRVCKWPACLTFEETSCHALSRDFSLSFELLLAIEHGRLFVFDLAL